MHDKTYKIYSAEGEGEIYGYIVLGQSTEPGIKREKVFDIAWDQDHKEVIDALILKAEEFCKTQGMDIISYASIADKGIRRNFRKNGFIRSPFRSREPFQVSACSSNIDLKYLTNPKRWYIQIGDYKKNLK